MCRRGSRRVGQTSTIAPGWRRYQARRPPAQTGTVQPPTSAGRGPGQSRQGPPVGSTDWRRTLLSKPCGRRRHVRQVGETPLPASEISPRTGRHAADPSSAATPGTAGRRPRRPTTAGATAAPQSYRPVRRRGRYRPLSTRRERPTGRSRRWPSASPRRSMSRASRASRSTKEGASPSPWSNKGETYDRQ